MKGKHVTVARRRAADSRARWEECVLDFLALGLSWRLTVFGRDASGAYRHLTRRELGKGRFCGGGTRFVSDRGAVYTDLAIRKTELVDHCRLAALLDRRRAATGAA